MNQLVPINTDENKYYVPITFPYTLKTDPSKSDLCEAYVLKEYLNEWDVAKLSYGNRPDWDVEITTNLGIRSFEVKTQSRTYDSIYIEIGEYGKQKPKSVPNDNWNQWVKTGLFVSEADTYVIFKETNNNLYNYYEIDASFLKNSIDSYLYTDLFGTIKDVGNEFYFKSNYKPNTTLNDTLEFLKNETFRLNKGVRKEINSSKLGYTDLQGVFQPYIKGFATTTEYNKRWNINILFNLQPMIDGGIIKKTIYNVDISLQALDDITKYFVGAEIDHYGIPIIDDLKKDFNDGKKTTNEITKELKTWNYDILFDKSYYDDNNQEKYPDMSLDKILRFQYDQLPFRYITEDLDKTLGIEKVGLGYDSDSSSSSSDSDTGLQFLNLISKK